MKILSFIFLLIPSFSAAQEKKLKIIEFVKLECEQDDGVDYPIVINRIIEQKMSNDTLSIKLGAWETCCVDFIPSASLVNNEIKLSYEKTGDPCECGCFYTFIFKIKGVVKNPDRVFFQNKVVEYSSEKYEIFPIRYKILNKDTVDFKDKYGRRQGKWVFKERYAVYLNDMAIEYAKLYSNQSIKSRMIGEPVIKLENGNEYTSICFNKYCEFFENGFKKKECLSNNETQDLLMDEGGICKEWDESGKLIYEGIQRKSDRP
jgi:hypothetical protein